MGQANEKLSRRTGALERILRESKEQNIKDLALDALHPKVNKGVKENEQSILRLQGCVKTPMLGLGLRCLGLLGS